jgi:hypothetical protein
MTLALPLRSLSHLQLIDFRLQLAFEPRQQPSALSHLLEQPAALSHLLEQPAALSHLLIYGPSMHFPTSSEL